MPPPDRLRWNRSSLPVDEWIAQREILHHAHERVVHALVAVRVILAEHVADHGCAFLYGRPGTRPASFMAYNTRRCTGFNPSRTSGNARETMTLIEYVMNDSRISSSMSRGRMRSLLIGEVMKRAGGNGGRGLGQAVKATSSPPENQGVNYWQVVVPQRLTGELRPSVAGWCRCVTVAPYRHQPCEATGFIANARARRCDHPRCVAPQALPIAMLPAVH